MENIITLKKIVLTGIVAALYRCYCNNNKKAFSRLIADYAAVDSAETLAEIKTAYKAAYENSLM